MLSQGGLHLAALPHHMQGAVGGGGRGGRGGGLAAGDGQDVGITGLAGICLFSLFIRSLLVLYLVSFSSILGLFPGAVQHDS